MMCLFAQSAQIIHDTIIVSAIKLEAMNYKHVVHIL